MYSSLFDEVFADSFFSPMITVYVVSDSQLEEIKQNQRKEELENIEASRKRLEESYQARVKVLDDREHELQEEIKALAPSANCLENHSYVMSPKPLGILAMPRQLVCIVY